MSYCFFFQAEDGIRDIGVTGVQTCALPISGNSPSGGDAAGPAGGTSRSLTGPSGGVPAVPGRPGSARYPRGSEERRVGEEWRSRGVPDHLKKKKDNYKLRLHTNDVVTIHIT